MFYRGNELLVSFHQDIEAKNIIYPPAIFDPRFYQWFCHVFNNVGIKRRLKYHHKYTLVSVCFVRAVWIGKLTEIANELETNGNMLSVTPWAFHLPSGSTYMYIPGMRFFRESIEDHNER